MFVNAFDMMLGACCGNEPGLCVFARQSGNAVAMEHDGGMYACGHYAYPEFSRGNAMDASFEAMIYSPEQVRFGAAKETSLPRMCRE